MFNSENKAFKPVFLYKKLTDSVFTLTKSVFTLTDPVFKTNKIGIRNKLRLTNPVFNKTGFRQYKTG